MAEGRKTGGRKKGTPNRMTKAVKEAIADVAEGLGGSQRMIAWAKQDPLNERAFWTNIYPKLLPLELNHGVQPENPLTDLLTTIAQNGRRIGSD